MVHRVYRDIGIDTLKPKVLKRLRYLIEKREQLRQTGHYQDADIIRVKLANIGIPLVDNSDGSTAIHIFGHINGHLLDWVRFGADPKFEREFLKGKVMVSPDIGYFIKRAKIEEKYKF